MVNVNAFVTLLTSESYIQGVVALAHSLHLTNTQNEIVCMVTKDISSDIVDKLEKPRKLFDRIIYVDEYNSKDQKNLKLLGRPELGITFTKLNVWKLVQYDYVAFLDADTIVLKNIDSLFDQIKQVHNQGNVAFIAAPDVGWPDHFNSGVFVCKPDIQTYSDLIDFSTSIGSFDGGDQGLLNRYFNQWNNIPNARLSFKYNVTPSTFYTYAPAYQEHQDDIKVVHFIGNSKPWLSNNRQGMVKKNTSTPSPFDTFIKTWWNIYGNYIVNNDQAVGRSVVSTALNYLDHPYDNAWQTNVIQEQNTIEENKSKEVIRDKAEDTFKDKSECIENKNDESVQTKDKEDSIDESKASTDKIRYKWQIHAKVNDDVLPLNSSTNHPTDHAFIIKDIETIDESLIVPKEDIESQPRDLNVDDFPQPISEVSQITNTIVSSKDEPQNIEVSPRELNSNSNENVNLNIINIPNKNFVSIQPKSFNTKKTKEECNTYKGKKNWKRKFC